MQTLIFDVSFMLIYPIEGKQKKSLLQYTLTKDWEAWEVFYDTVLFMRRRNKAGHILDFTRFLCRQQRKYEPEMQYYNLFLSLTSRKHAYIKFWPH